MKSKTLILFLAVLLASCGKGSGEAGGAGGGGAGGSGPEPAPNPQTPGQVATCLEKHDPFQGQDAVAWAVAVDGFAYLKQKCGPTHSQLRAFATTKNLLIH